MKSDITGHGYGDKHIWECHGTDQHPIPSHRSTLWKCARCPEMFRHWYHETPDIFEAMKNARVKEECE